MKLLITGCVGAAMVAALLVCGCGGSRSQPGDMTDSASSGIDYEKLQEKAKAFVPAIGKVGGEIVLSTFSDPKSFNPITSTEMTTTEFTSYMYEPLVTSNGVTLLPEPSLAESWEVSDDGLAWTFFIRPGVQWFDGKPFSAYDVEFTFNDLVYNTDISPNSGRDIFLIEGNRIKIKVVDSMKIVFKLPYPYAPFLRLMMAQEILPKHAYRKFVKKGTFSTELGIKTAPEDMVGTGPFMLESYLSSQKVVLKRNPNYWKKDSAGNRLPYLERVIYKIVADQNAELLQFKKGLVDYIQAKGEDFPGLKKDEGTSDYTVYRLGPATGSNFLIFNQNTENDSTTKKPYVEGHKLGWFTNVNFRRAIAHALDKQNMINIVMNGLGYPQWSPMTPSEGYFYNPDVGEYPYDLKKARELLKQEGFVDSDGDGILEDKNGEQLEFSFVTNSGNVVRQRIAEIIRKDLETLGCKVHFQLLEFNSLIQKMDNPPYGWDAVLLGLTGGVEPHLGKNVWHSSGTLHLWHPRQKKPQTSWEAAIDSLFDLGVRTMENEKRKEIYDRWQEIVAEQLPLIYTVLPERIYCITNRFGNLNPSLNGGLLHNYEYLYVK